MKTFKKFKLNLFAVMLFIFTASIQMLKAQESISMIRSVPELYSELNETQQGIYDDLLEITGADTLYLVQVGVLNNDPLYKNGEVNIILPFLSFDTLTYWVNFIEYETEDDYRWGGNIKEPYFFTDTIRDTATNFCSSGGLTLVSIDGRKYGTFSAESHRYVIKDLTDGVQVIIEQAVLPSERLECGNKEVSPEPEPYSSSTDPCIGHTLRVLVFYSNLAAEPFSGSDPEAVALQGLTQLQSTLQNSLIFSQNNNIFLAGVQDLYFVENPSDVVDDVRRFSNNSTVISERAAHDADLCILLTNAGYNGGYYDDEYGRARKIGPEFDSAFAIVEINHAAVEGEYIFTHAIGHLFGARHDLNHENGDDTDYSHGYTLTGANHILEGEHDYYRDMMGKPNHDNNNEPAYNGDTYGNEPRIPCFSNPDNEWLGSYPTGADPYENNYLKITNTMDRVVDFYTEYLGGLEVEIDLEPFNACDEYIEGTANVTCGSDGNDEYQWYVGNNGIAYTILTGETSPFVSY
ncbi:MAG: M12 family metallo-peptidase, partial [Bacteroidota bacterium]